MIVRYENTKNGTLLIIDECDVFHGECYSEDFIECMEERDSFIENEYDYFFVDKEKLNFCFQSFSAVKLNK